MKKQKKQRKNKKISVLLFGCILFLAVVLGGACLLVSFFPTGYRIEDRTAQMEKVEKEEGDTVLGWLRVEGTNIDMALIYRDTNTDLHKLDYDFAWSYPKTETLQNRAIFSSHNVLNVSSNPLMESESFRRFEPLPAFLYKEFAEKNQLIQYTVGGKNYLYQIFSVSMVEESEIDYDHDSFEKDILSNYIKKAKEESYYDYDLDVNENDSLLTLVTCTRFFGATDDYALKIEARKVRENEKAKKVKLRVKSNYDMVEERMKEGDNHATA